MKKNKKNTTRLFLLFVILFVLPTIASAGFGARFGFSKDAQSDTYDKGMTMIGADFRFSAFPIVDVIGTIEYSWKKYKISNLIQVEGSRHFLTINASIVKSFDKSLVKPYAGFGYGFHAMGGTTQEDILKGGTRNGTGFHVIGGVKVAPPAAPISVYGEYRHYWTNFSGDKKRYFSLSAGVMLGF